MEDHDRAHQHGQSDESLYSNARHVKCDKSLSLRVMDCRDNQGDISTDDGPEFPSDDDGADPPSDNSWDQGGKPNNNKMI